MQDYITMTIKDICREILKGKIDIRPINNSGKKPCEYCPYKSVCGFDTKFSDNKYKYIDKKQKDQVILEMKEKLKNAKL